MRAVIDTNVFVYATYPHFQEHRAALEFLRRSRSGPDISLIHWGIIYEYLRVVTHPRLFSKGVISFLEAAANVEKFCEGSSVEMMQETAGHWNALRTVVKEIKKSRGNILHDCHTVALMQEHDVRRIYTADTDFRLFPDLEIINPVSLD